jgi:hypothetical protein
VLPAGQSAVLVVHEINSGTSVGCAYTLTVIGSLCPPVVVPTLGRWGLAALALMFLGTAVVVLRLMR